MHEHTRVARREKSLASARLLAVLILVAAALAAGLGLFGSFPADSPDVVVNAWGQTIDLDGSDLYRRDSVSGAVQERAQDWVTLVFAIPLLGIAWLLSRSGGLGSRMLLAGALGYFLYCYGMMSLGTAYNEAFLLYVALFAASLHAFVQACLSIDIDRLAERCQSRFPRRSAAALCAAVALLLGLAWLGRLAPSLGGRAAPAGLDAYSTLFVQAIDLAILVPAAALAAFWLLRKDPRGYLLGGVVLVKGAAEGLAVAAMGFAMLANGIAESLPLIVAFLSLALGACLLGAKAVLSAGVRGDIAPSAK